MNVRIIVFDQPGVDHYPEVKRRLDERFNRIKESNPRGFLDSFESQFETICMDIALDMGGKIAMSGQVVGISFHPVMSQDSLERRVARELAPA